METLVNMETKICTKCKLPKKLSEFNETSNINLSYRSDCKECQKKYSKEHYDNNKQRYLDNQKIRRDRNKKSLDKT